MRRTALAVSVPSTIFKSAEVDSQLTVPTTRVSGSRRPFGTAPRNCRTPAMRVGVAARSSSAAVSVSVASAVGAGVTLLVAVAVADAVMVGRELVVAVATVLAVSLGAGSMGDPVAVIDDPVEDVHPETALIAASRLNESANVRAPFVA